ncbi:MAG: glycosyltransferase, partial [Methanomicrobiales archaeon]
QRMVTERKLEGNLTFIGFLEHHNEVIAVMKSSRVFATPSVREGFGIAALEALACGLQVVTVDAPKNAVKELVTDKTGVICDPTPEAFAQAVLLCLKRKDSMMEECKMRSASYDWETIVSDVEEYYSGIIKGNS